uniref:Putative secreted protein n=1 Tax=Anopheles darlingi TaxID=43151 RepID=A0A2M4DNB3_ANODA
MMKFVLPSLCCCVLWRCKSRRKMKMRNDARHTNTTNRAVGPRGGFAELQHVVADLIHNPLDLGVRRRHAVSSLSLKSIFLPFLQRRSLEERAKITRERRGAQ